MRHSYLLRSKRSWTACILPLPARKRVDEIWLSLLEEDLYWPEPTRLDIKILAHKKRAPLGAHELQRRLKRLQSMNQKAKQTTREAFYPFNHTIRIKRVHQDLAPCRLSQVQSYCLQCKRLDFYC